MKRTQIYDQIQNHIRRTVILMKQITRELMNLQAMDHH
jgi:hypothetical protein